jgi:UDP-glucuronate 4-epimerase
MDFVRAIEKELGVKARINYMPIQPGDVTATQADVSALKREVGYEPSTTVEEGIREFVKWYRGYYKM